jgi:signal peptidase I
MEKHMTAGNEAQKQQHTKESLSGVSETLSTEKLQIERRNRERRSWIISIASAVAIALVLRFFVFEFVRIDGPSMEPTLHDNEYVFMEKAAYWFSAPQRGDVIICHFPNSRDTYVKRVIGVGGDTLSIQSGVLYINGEASSDYFSGTINHDMAETAVPDGCVFVMGDNRNHSTDSRVVGTLKRDMVLGRAIWIIWPPDEIGGI